MHTPVFVSIIFSLRIYPLRLRHIVEVQTRTTKRWSQYQRWIQLRISASIGVSLLEFIESVAGRWVSEWLCVMFSIIEFVMFFLSFCFPFFYGVLDWSGFSVYSTYFRFMNAGCEKYGVSDFWRLIRWSDCGMWYALIWLKWFYSSFTSKSKVELLNIFHEFEIFAVDYRILWFS